MRCVITQMAMAEIQIEVEYTSDMATLSLFAGNPAIEEMIAPQWPHMRRSMATVLAELDYRASAWAEHEAIAARYFRRRRAGRGKRGAGACADRGTQTEERLKRRAGGVAKELSFRGVSQRVRPIGRPDDRLHGEPEIDNHDWE